MQCYLHQLVTLHDCIFQLDIVSTLNTGSKNPSYSKRQAAVNLENIFICANDVFLVVSLLFMSFQEEIYFQNSSLLLDRFYRPVKKDVKLTNITS